MSRHIIFVLNVPSQMFRHYLLFLRCKTLRRYCHIDVINDFLYIVHRHVFLLKSDVSEGRFCLRPLVKAYTIGPNR
jgi:hypothetical protein